MSNLDNHLHYPLLFSPGYIGRMEVKNRIVMPALGTGLAGPDGRVNDRVIAYYSKRAKSGVGLIITDTGNAKQVRSAAEAMAEGMEVGLEL